MTIPGRTLGEVLHRARVAGGEQSAAPCSPVAVVTDAREGGWRNRAEAAEGKLAEVRTYCERRWVERDGFSWVRAYDILAIIGAEGDEGPK